MPSYARRTYLALAWCCWLLYWLLGAGCWLLVGGCWLLAAGCWLLAAGPPGSKQIQMGIDLVSVLITLWYRRKTT